MLDRYASNSGPPYRTLLTDPALLSVLFVAFASGTAMYAVPPALPSIESAFGLTEARLGLVMSVFSLSVLVLLPITGVLADIYGRRKVVIPSLLVFGASGMTTLFVTSFDQLLAIRAIQGAAFAGTIPLTQTLVGDLYTGVEGTAAQGIRSSLIGVASTLSPLIAGALAALLWTYPFAVFGLAFPAAVVVYLYYPETIPENDTTARRLRVELRLYWRDVTSEAIDRTLGLLLLGGFVLFFVKQGVLTFVPVFMVQSIGSNLVTVGIVLSVYGFIRMVCSPFAGEIMSLLGRKRAMLGSVLAVIVGGAGIPLATSVYLVGLAVSVYSLGEAFLNPVLTDSVAAFTNDSHRGGVMSALGMHKETGLMISPVVLGVVIAAGSFTAAFAIAAAVALSYGIAIVLFFRPGDGDR